MGTQAGGLLFLTEDLLRFKIEDKNLSPANVDALFKDAVQRVNAARLQSQQKWSRLQYLKHISFVSRVPQAEALLRGARTLLTLTLNREGDEPPPHGDTLSDFRPWHAIAERFDVVKEIFHIVDLDVRSEGDGR